MMKQDETIELAIASDHAGVELKKLLKQEAETLGFSCADLGTHGTDSVDYPDTANALSRWVLEENGRAGVLICGSGVGVSIAANRHPGIRAALCHDGLSAELARRHNDANVLCLGARLIGQEVAREVVRRFLSTGFEGGRHEKRVHKLG